MLCHIPQRKNDCNYGSGLEQRNKTTGQCQTFRFYYRRLHLCQNTCIKVFAQSYFLLNLLTAAMRQETLRFSAWDYRGITYVREAVERLTQAMELPGGVYNFGSENDCDMVTTARRACELLDIHPVIEAADWPRSLLMDGGRFRAAAGVGFDDTLTGVQRCLRDYGLLK